MFQQGCLFVAVCHVINKSGQKRNSKNKHEVKVCPGYSNLSMPIERRNFETKKEEDVRREHEGLEEREGER